ncbi:hypothetical protein ACU686_16940 [Yinghuangia aomiensis]
MAGFDNAIKCLYHHELGTLNLQTVEHGDGGSAGGAVHRVHARDEETREKLAGAADGDAAGDRAGPGGHGPGVSAGRGFGLGVGRGCPWSAGFAGVGRVSRGLLIPLAKTGCL